MNISGLAFRQDSLKRADDKPKLDGPLKYCWVLYSLRDKILSNMVAEDITDGWDAPYSQLRMVCYECSEWVVYNLALFNLSEEFTCLSCGKAFSQEEGILRQLLSSIEDSLKEVEKKTETEANHLKFVDKEVFDGSRFGSNDAVDYTGYLKEDRPLELEFPIAFGYSPSVFSIIYPQGLNEIPFANVIPSDLDRVIIEAFGLTPSGCKAPLSLQVHGATEQGVVVLPPYFVFLKSALRSLVQREYALAVFLGAAATEAFLDALLSDEPIGTSNPDAVFELVSKTGLNHKVQQVSSEVLGRKIPEELSKRFSAEVRDVRNTYAHGRLPNVSLVQALVALKLCLEYILWALRVKDELA